MMTDILSDREKNKSVSEYISTNLSQMKEVRSYYEPDWEEACRLFKHRTHKSYGSSNLKNIEPMVLSGTYHIQCLQTTIDGFSSQLLSPTIRWFRYHILGNQFATESDIPYVKDWAEQVENIQNHVYDNSPSRFYSNTLLALTDAFVMGISYEIIADDIKNRSVTFDCYNPWECYSRHNSNKVIDTVYREFSLTCIQAQQRWGKENLPSSIQDKINNGAGWEYCTFVNAIYPDEQTTDSYGNHIKTSTKKYTSIYYYADGDEEEKIFAVSGYNTFPLAVHRWEVEGNEDYGSSPVLKHLETFKKYISDEKMRTVTLQKLADPQMIGPETLRGRMTNRPGAKIYYPSSEGKPEYLQIRTDLNAIIAVIESDKQEIMRLLYTDLFKVLMLQDRQKTAYEVQQIKGEGMALLSATVGNIQVEKLVPIIKRTFLILQRNNALPEMPEELKKAYTSGRIKIELDGPLIQTMQKYNKASGLVNGLQGLGSIAQIFPTSLVNINSDEYTRQLSSAMGVPESIIREKIEVEKIKAEQAKMAQQQAQQQQAEQASNTLKNLSSMQQ